eukprot:9759831-Alexandrium_andersonii.AAC.1
MACQKLMDCCKRHVSLLQRASVPLAPKHHLWAHMTMMSLRRGNPRWYSTFLDESLNAVVARIAA